MLYAGRMTIHFEYECGHCFADDRIMDNCIVPDDGQMQPPLQPVKPVSTQTRIKQRYLAPSRKRRKGMTAVRRWKERRKNT